MEDPDIDLLDPTLATEISSDSEVYSEYSPAASDDDDVAKEAVRVPPPVVAAEEEEEMGSSSQGNNSRGEIDGLYCSICMEPWSNGGDHQVCCLPCGHLYGLRCVKRWLQHRKSLKKCPQCNSRCTLKDVRVIYAQQIVVVDHEIQKKVEYLEAKCASLEKKDKEWLEKEAEWRKKESDLHLQVRQFTKGTFSLENMQRRPARFSNAGLNDLKFGGQGSLAIFTLKEVLHLEGAKLFDLDVPNKVVIFARRLTGLGGMHALTKMSLIAPHEQEDIPLPANTKAIRELRMAPDGRLALLASAGKKLSVMSTQSNNIVLSYDLPVAGWSCSWDLSSSFYIYTGLQNGMLMMFDTRQTSRPVQSIAGFTSNPIHSLHCLSKDSSSPSGARSLLTASSAGLCQWNFDDIAERPLLVPESQNQGVCIACAYSPTSKHIVASFRPKVVDYGNDVSVSQLSLPHATSAVMGQSVQGTNALYKNLGDKFYQKLGSTYTNVDSIRLPRSVVVDNTNNNIQFACGDELNCELVLQDLPSLVVGQRLTTEQPIRDVRYTPDMSLLSCLSGDVLQIFSPHV